MNNALTAAVQRAVAETLEELGVEKFKQTSLFISNRRVSAFAKAA